MKINGVDVSKVSSNFSDIASLQKKANIPQDVISANISDIENINTEIQENKQTSNYYNLNEGSKRIISDEANINNDNPEEFLQTTIEQINKLKQNVSINEEHKKKLDQNISQNILNHFYNLKNSEAEISFSIAKQTSLKDFIETSAPILESATLNEEKSENIINHFLANLYESDYSKYSSDEEKEALARQFALEYNDYAIANSVAEKPLNEAYASMNDDDSLLNDNAKARDLFFKKTDQVIANIDAEEEINVARMDIVTKKYTENALKNLNQPSVVDESISILEDIGAKEEANILRNKQQFYNTFNIDNPPNYKFASEFAISGILKQINNGTLTEEDVNNMLENEDISYEHADIFNKAIIGNGSEQYKYCNTLAKSLTSKYANDIFIGNESEDDVENLRLTDNRSYNNKAKISNLYDPGMKQIRSDIMAGIIQTPQDINLRINALDNSINGLIVNNQQNINKPDVENMNIASISDGISNLLNNSDGIFNNMNLSEIENIIKTIYG